MIKQFISPAQKCNRARQILQQYWDDSITEEMVAQAKAHMLACKHFDPQHFCHVYCKKELTTKEEIIAEVVYKIKPASK